MLLAAGQNLTASAVHYHLKLLFTPSTYNNMSFIAYLSFMLTSMFMGGIIALLCFDNPPDDEKPKQKKIIMKTVSDVATHLADIIEAPHKASHEDMADKQYLFELLVRALADDQHPDTPTLLYIGERVIANKQKSDVWSIWFIISLRRIAKNIRTQLPEPWFLDLSDITDETPISSSNTPLISPILTAASGPTNSLELELEPLPLPEPAVEDTHETQQENINDISMSSNESDSDDSQKMLTEAGPLATPTCPNEEAEPIFSEEVEDIASKYIPVNKYIQIIASGPEERDLSVACSAEEPLTRTLTAVD